MPRFVMGALALTSACLGYLLAARWDDEARRLAGPTMQDDLPGVGGAGRHAGEMGSRLRSGSDYPLGV